MQISNEEINRLLALTPKGASPLQKGGRATVSLEGMSDTDVAARVEVSASSQEVKQVKAQIEQMPDVREDRVQALKAQIESGKYQVSGEDIADLIIRRSLADNTAF